MAKHEIIIRENTSATKESAPFLGTYQSKGTTDVADQYDEMAALSGLPKIQLQAILEGSFAAFAEWETTELVRIYTDLGQICGKIGGSFSSADAAFDATKNSFDLVIHLDDAVKLDLVGVTPTIVTDQTVTRVAINNVMDKEVNRPLNLIHGQNTFRLAGYNVVMSDEGAECCLLDENNVSHSCTVTEQLSNQLFEAHSDELLEGGDYKLVVKSRGGDAEGPLQTVFRKVKYLKIAPAKKVTAFSNFTCSLAANKITATLVNGEGTLDYSAAGGYVLGDLYKNGNLVTMAKEMSWNATSKAFECEIGAANYEVGDTAKVILHPDPAKEQEYEQNDTVGECTVTA